MALDQQGVQRPVAAGSKHDETSAGEQGPKTTDKPVAQKSGLTWKAPETYFAIGAFVAIIILVVILLVSAPTSNDAIWGRMLTIVNGPGAVFIAILGAILGFSANQVNVKNARDEKGKAEADKENAIKAKNESAAKVDAVKSLLNEVPVAEINARREDPSYWVESLVAPSDVAADLGRTLRLDGSYDLAPSRGREPIDPLLAKVGGIVTAARDICNRTL